MNAGISNFQVQGKFHTNEEDCLDCMLQATCLIWQVQILPSPCILPREASLGDHTGDGSAAGGGAVTATITPPPSSSVFGREMPDRRVRNADKFGWYSCRSLVEHKFHYVLCEEKFFLSSKYKKSFTLSNCFPTFNFTDFKFISCAMLQITNLC